MSANKTQVYVKVLRIISQHTKGNPVVGRVIAFQLGTQLRTVTTAVQALRFKGFKIGMSREKPMGYFLAMNREEMRDTIKLIKQQCLMQLKMIQKLLEWGDEPVLWDGIEFTEIEELVRGIEELEGEPFVEA